MEDQNYTIKDIARMAVFPPERLTECCTIAATYLLKARLKYKRYWMKFTTSLMYLLSDWLPRRNILFVCLIPII